MAWIKVSERRPTADDAVDYVVMWRDLGKEKIQISAYSATWMDEDNMEWHPIIVPDDSEPAQSVDLPQLGQMIWVRDYDGDMWVKRLFSRFGTVAFCNTEGGTEVEWLQWSLTDPNKPPEPQCRPFANAAEFWPFRDCWWKVKNSTDAHPPCRFSDERYGDTKWGSCFESLELLEDIDGKMVPRPFGVLVKPETNIS